MGLIGAGNRPAPAPGRAPGAGHSGVYVWNASKPALVAFAQEMHQETACLSTPAPQRKRPSVRPDILFTVTIGRRGPIVRREWIKPGTHIACIGADMPDKQELFADVFRGAKIVNDSIDLCSEKR